MTGVDFAAAPSDQFSGALLALWWDAHGDWEKAHEIAADVGGTDGARVHAYLHRKQADLSNAAYWYRAAGKPVAQGDLRVECEALVFELLGSDPTSLQE